MNLVLISNRLPVTVTEQAGTLNFERSAGGLVSGLSAYLDSLRSSPYGDSRYLWIGWPGTTVPEEEKDNVKSQLQSECQAVPVFISEKDMDAFYLGFCNKTIWPLFHYFGTRAVFDENYWKSYQEVNQTFCDSVVEVVRPGDVVWVHDYHLMLLPKLLRRKAPGATIGFFLHIPFPSHELFRMLPREWSKEILEGLLGADLVGFHTYDYSDNFLRCVSRVLGLEHSKGTIPVNSRLVRVDTFPMGIDFQKFHTSAKSAEVGQEKDKLRDALRGAVGILSIDRLDYTKGVINRLRAFEIFLETNPDWLRKVVLMMVVVPSRIGVEHYQRMKRQIDEEVGKMNGTFGDIEWTPILYQYRSLPFDPLVALYAVSDVALVTPLRDGMNLVAKEYVATRTEQTGVLILSEMAGAANELGEALIVNPHHAEEIAAALVQALKMPKDEQVHRNRAMQAKLRRHDVASWVDEFTRALLAVKTEQKQISETFMARDLRDQLVRSFHQARRRLLLLDYDGTLVSYADEPRLARPTKRVLEVLGTLAAQHATEVVLVSGRDKNTLATWFGVPRMSFVAEHGIWIRERDDHWRMTSPVSGDWKSRVLPILERYANQLPGAFVEEKEFSCAWHYRKADPELASLRAKELLDDLAEFIDDPAAGIKVLQGNRVIELACGEINKGTAATHFLFKDSFDFVLAIGDDATDEDLFQAVPDTAYSIRVGVGRSCARFCLPGHLEVLQLLDELGKGAIPESGHP